MVELSMSVTIAECLQHARQCEWYAARTNDEGDRKFLLWRAQQWTKLAQEKELEAREPRIAKPLSTLKLISWDAEPGSNSNGSTERQPVG